MSTIGISEVIKRIDAGEMFSVSYVTYDAKRKSGGNLREFPEAQITFTKKEKALFARSKKKASKPTAHYKNATRNIKTFIGGTEVAGNKRIHLYLITIFNGKTVVL